MTKWLIVFCFATLMYGQGQNIDGNWTGEMKAAGRTFHFNVHLKSGGGTWESVDQHVTAPVNGITLSGNAVKISINSAAFDGVLNQNAVQITGNFKQGDAEYPLTLSRFEGEFVKRARAQEPKRPFPYTEEEVSVESAGVTLAGTLTLPKSGGPFATVLLLTGSGPQDRDESLMDHRPFLVLSDSLTRAGFAVLRLDDRGVGKSTGVFPKASYADKVADVISAIRFLKGRRDLDITRFGVLGHSEGASIGVQAAVESRDIHFVVMLGGLGIKGEDLLRQQGIDLARAAGASDEQVATQVEVQSKIFAAYRNPKSLDAARAEARLLLGDSPQAEVQIAAMESPSLQNLLTLDGAEALRKLLVPVLAIGGSLDKQVSARQNLPAIATALAMSGSKDWQVNELEGLNHLFQKAQTGGIAEYASIEETMSPVALRAINIWLSERFLTRVP